MSPVVSSRPRRFLPRLAVAGITALAFVMSTPAAERPTAYQVKAAFLERFGKFVEWPESAFAGPQASLVIGIYGADPFRGALEELAAQEKINGHPVEIRHLDNLSDLRSCHILFLPATERSAEDELLRAVAGSSVLTVGDADDFCQAGGMIQFILENDRVHFQVNNEAARAAGLKISSKLLTLAKPVKK